MKKFLKKLGFLTILFSIGFSYITTYAEETNTDLLTTFQKSLRLENLQKTFVAKQSGGFKLLAAIDTYVKKQNADQLWKLRRNILDTIFSGKVKGDQERWFNIFVLKIEIQLGFLHDAQVAEEEKKGFKMNGKLNIIREGKVIDLNYSSGELDGTITVRSKVLQEDEEELIDTLYDYSKGNLSKITYYDFENNIKSEITLSEECNFKLIDEKGNLKKGIPECAGIKTFFTDGKATTAVEYDKIFLNGAYIRYNEDGRFVKIPFQNGQPIGKFIWYDKNGNMEKILEVNN